MFFNNYGLYINNFSKDFYFGLSRTQCLWQCYFVSTLIIKDRYCSFTHENSELLCKRIRAVRDIHDHFDITNNDNSVKTCKPVPVGCEVYIDWGVSILVKLSVVVEKITAWCFFSFVGGVICNFCIAEHGSRCHCCQFCASCCK